MSTLHKPAQSSQPSFVMFLPPSHPWLKLPLDRLEDIVGACVEVRVQELIPTAVTDGRRKTQEAALLWRPL